MKSSTLRRSTLSKESMDVIETLSKEQTDNTLIDEYIRPEDENVSPEQVNKAQEIDMLWQSFKTAQFNSNSPAMYILTGFVIGVIFTSVCVWGYHYYSKSHKAVKVQPNIEAIIDNESEGSVQQDSAVSEPPQQQQEAEPSDNSVQENNAVTEPLKTQKYKVKNGDTGESIIKKFYGSYSPEKAEKIIKLNNLKNLDRINIDQELLIPVE